MTTINKRKKYFQEYNKKYQKRRRELYKLNIERKRKLDKEHYHRNKERHRELHISMRYGITVEEYRALFLKYNNLCAICRKSESAKNKCLSVDHSHITGRVRGLLCSRCNKAIGFLQDNIEILDKVKDYLSNASKT